MRAKAPRGLKARVTGPGERMLRSGAEWVERRASELGVGRWAPGVASGCSGPSGVRGDGPREACGREERSWAEGMGRERREGARAGLRKGLGCLGWVLGFFSYFSFSISNSNSSQMNSNKFEFKL